jgi:hypothetical protein
MKRCVKGREPGDTEMSDLAEMLQGIMTTVEFDFAELQLLQHGIQHIAEHHEGPYRDQCERMIDKLTAAQDRIEKGK